MNDHLDAIGITFAAERKDVENKISNNINWNSLPPGLRLQYIRNRINNAIRNALEDIDEKRGIKKGLPNSKRGKKEKNKAEQKRSGRKKKKPNLKDRSPKKNKKPSPIKNSPIIDEDEDIILPREPKQPPRPRDSESPPQPPKKKKDKWNSRVGYFATLSDLQWYGETPKIHESPYIDLHFNELADQYLSLRPGESWQSEWFDTGVIRGLNINVLGKHQLNFARNGDFEV